MEYASCGIKQQKHLSHIKPDKLILSPCCFDDAVLVLSVRCIHYDTHMTPPPLSNLFSIYDINRLYFESKVNVDII